MRVDIRRVCTLLKVLDMPTSAHFYRDVLGLEIIETSPREADHFESVLLRAKDAELMLNTTCGTQSRPVPSGSGRELLHLDDRFNRVCST
ncbi:VOC family protein [Stenotrophomonas maltophilia]|uniref:VOC family protein n=1 Tax=Stenotrophomonas maltophilia TaxID=40324 RepID=UPI0013DBA595|nr:VOC family protein [Stenotrophomonas maltophilia]MBN7838661.1 hypothetical protein [Stenotrophomonas maltophilia]